MEDLKLHGLIGGNGNSTAIKSIQTGYATVNGTSTTCSATITSVDTSKSIVFVYPPKGSNNGYQQDWALTSFTSTQVTFTRQGNLSVWLNVYFIVIEFDSAFVKSKQTGSQYVNSTTYNKAITSVNSSKSIVAISWNSSSSGGGGTNCRANLTSATNLELVGESYTTIYYQVLELK